MELDCTGDFKFWSSKPFNARLIGKALQGFKILKGFSIKSKNLPLENHRKFLGIERFSLQINFVTELINWITKVDTLNKAPPNKAICREIWKCANKVIPFLVRLGRKVSPIRLKLQKQHDCTKKSKSRSKQLFSISESLNFQ